MTLVKIYECVCVCEWEGGKGGMEEGGGRKGGRGKRAVQ